MREKSLGGSQGKGLAILLFGLAVAIALMALEANLAFRWHNFGANDFVAYWSVPRALLFGHGMYNQIWLEGIQRALDFPGYEFSTARYPVMPLWNPPPLLILLLPIASLPFTPAVLTWALLGTTLLGYATLRFNLSLPGKLPTPVALLAAFVLVPTIIAMHEGQPTLLLVSCVLFAWMAQLHRRYIATAILLIPLLLKVHMFSVVLVLFTITLYRRREWSAIAAFVGGVVLLTTALTVLDPRWVTGFLSQGISLAPAPSLWNLGELVFALPQTAKIVAVPLGLLTATWRYRDVYVVSARELGEASILSVVFSPYVWNHDVIVLLPAVLYLTRALWRPWWRLALFIPSLLLSSPLVTAEVVLELFGPFASIAARIILLLSPGGRVEHELRFALALALYVVFWRLAVRTRETQRVHMSDGDRYESVST